MDHRDTRGFLVNIGIATGMLWLIPHVCAVPLSLLILCAPDAGWLLLLSGVLALVTLSVSMGVMVFLIRQSGQFDE